MSEQALPQVIHSFWLDVVEPLRDFYMQKLGFEHMMGIVGKDGRLDFAIVTRDGLSIMMGSPEKRMEGLKPGGDRTVDIYIREGRRCHARGGKPAWGRDDAGA